MENKPQFPIGSKSGGLSYSATVFFNLLLTMTVGLIVQASALTGSEAATYLSLLTSPIAVAVVLALTLRVAKQPARVLLPIKTNPKYYLIAVLLAFGALFSLSQLNEWVVELAELLGYQRRDGFVPDVAGWKIVPVLLVVALIPAVMEETLFRGILLNNAESELGTVRVILVSGFCFSLYHGSVEQTVYQFVVGCLLGLLAVRSRSLGPCVLLHFLNNAVILILLACGAYDEATGALLVSQGAEIALYALSAVSLVGGLVWLVLDKKELIHCQSGGVKTFFLWAAVGIAIMAVIWVVTLFPAPVS